VVISDIEHHAWRGGLDAALGYDEFAAPTSSGEQLKRPTALPFEAAATRPPSAGGVAARS
jgi:hypothetical protein